MNKLDEKYSELTKKTDKLVNTFSSNEKKAFLVGKYMGLSYIIKNLIQHDATPPKIIFMVYEKLKDARTELDEELEK